MKRSVLLIFLCFFSVLRIAQAQTAVPLRYGQELPKNLYAAPTAVLVSYTTNQEISDAESARKISELSTQLLTDNQQIGLQLLHFAGKDLLAEPAAKKRLLRAYDSLKIENLLFLEVSEITGLGAQGSYVLKLTAFNKTPKMMNANQRAFLLQAETYRALVSNFKGMLSDYNPAYFQKGPERTPLKPNLATEPSQETAPLKPGTTSPSPLSFPLLKLTADGETRGNGGPTRNFYYYVGASQQEKNAGFFGQHLRKDVRSSPEALVHLNKYRNYKIGYLAERAVFVSSVALYANEVLSGDDYIYFNDRQKVLIGVAAGSLLVNVLIVRKTNTHIRRAINEYNAFATMQNQSGFWRWQPDNWGLGAVSGGKVHPGLTLHWHLR